MPVSVPLVSVLVSLDDVSSLVVLEVVPVLPLFFVVELAATEPSGTESAGFSRLVGFSWTSLLPQPETAVAKAISAIAADARNFFAGDAWPSAGIRRRYFGGGNAAVAVRTVVYVLLQKLLARAAADAEVFCCPGKTGLRFTDGENLADDDELRSGLAVDVTVALFNACDDVALVASGTQAEFL